MTDGRAKNGGARNGSGRKSKEQLLELHNLMLDAWPTAARRATVERLSVVAQSDSKAAVEAAKVLLAYAYGKPIDRKEISGPDGEPLKAYHVVNPSDWDNPEEPAA